MLPTRRLAAAATYWLASGAAWSAVGVVLLPEQVSRVVGESHKGRALGVALSIGATLALFFAPLVGAWSDRSRSRWGRRVPFVTGGSIATACALALLGLLPLGRDRAAYLSLVGGYLLFHATYNLAAAPIAAWIPDDVPEAQRGRASSWVALFRMLGTLAGGALGLAFGALGRRGTYATIAAISLVVLPSTLYGMHAKDGSSTHGGRPAGPQGLRGLWSRKDFRAVFLSRFAAMTGFFVVQSYLLYFLRDVVGTFRLGEHVVSRSAEQAAGLFMIVLVVGATVASPVAGAWFDGARRRLAIHGALALQSVAAIACASSRSFAVVLVASFLFGAGFGAFQTATLALASSAIPPHRAHARDLGIWNASLVLAQLVAAPLAGFVLDAMRAARPHAPSAGYAVLFATSVASFAVAAFVLRGAGRDDAQRSQV